MTRSLSPRRALILSTMLTALLMSSAASAQREERPEVLIEMPVQAVSAGIDRPGFRALPRRAEGAALGRRHAGTLPLRAHFRARVAASAGGL